MTDKFVEHIARDLLKRWIATANQPRVKEWVPALGAQRRAIVDAITVVDAGEVVVESPAPIIRGPIEDPGPTAGLIDGHGPVFPFTGVIGKGVAAESGWGNLVERRDGVRMAREDACIYWLAVSVNAAV